MNKTSFTTLLALAAGGAIGYFAFYPDAARDAAAWIQRQVGREVPVPDTPKINAPNYSPYTPVIPGK